MCSRGWGVVPHVQPLPFCITASVQKQQCGAIGASTPDKVGASTPDKVGASTPDKVGASLAWYPGK